MEDSYVHLQRGRAQSVSGEMDHTYEQITLSIQPPEKRQLQSAITTSVKVILGLVGAVVLVALVVAVVALVLNQQHRSELNELKGKIYNLEQMVHQLLGNDTKSTGRELPLSSPSETVFSTTPVTPVLTTSTPGTPAPTTSTPVTPVPTTSTPGTPVPTTSTPSTPALTAPTSATTAYPTDTSPTSCAAIHSSRPSDPSGVYTIHIGGRVQGRIVWCDMEADGGGWTRFQRRQDGSVEFNRTWSEYITGFGTANTEFWLGNDDIHALTFAQPSELRVDLWDCDGNHGYAKYFTFSVESASTNYTLHVGGYSGNIGDSLTGQHNSMQFTTKNRDNDWRSGGNCATLFGGGGGWWYRSCDKANLNGRYFLGGVDDQHGVEWESWRDSHYSYKAAYMMVRPRN